LTKNKIVLFEIAALTAVSTVGYILDKNIKPIIGIGLFVVFLSLVMLDPPSKYRKASEKDVENYKGPFAKPSATPKISLEETKNGKLSIKRHE